MKFILEYFRVENFWGTAKKCVLSKVIQKMEGIVLSKFFFLTHPDRPDIKIQIS